MSLAPFGRYRLASFPMITIEEVGKFHGAVCWMSWNLTPLSFRPDEKAFFCSPGSPTELRGDGHKGLAGEITISHDERVCVDQAGVHRQYAAAVVLQDGPVPERITPSLSIAIALTRP